MIQFMYIEDIIWLPDIVDKLGWKHNVVPEMENDKQSLLDKYSDIADYWDENSLADHWEQTEEADFEISPDARRRYLVAIDPSVLTRVQSLARTRGIATESLVNLFLEQHLQTLGA